MLGPSRLKLTLLTLLPLCMPLAAEETLTAEEPELRRYTVEVIVFIYEEDVSIGSEIFVPERVDADALDFKNDDESESVPTYADERTARPMPRFEYRRLRRDQLTMTDTARMLDRLQAYEPLMHIGWTQTTLPDMETPSIPLDKLGNPPRGLSGTLNLYLSRYLHLVVDVALDAPQTTNRPDADRFVKPLQYLINEDRIMKNDEIRYYDHPKFGVIARVSRVEAESDEQSTVRSNASLGQ